MRGELGNLWWKQCVWSECGVSVSVSASASASVSVSVEGSRRVRPDETGLDDLEMEARRRWRNGWGARGGETQV